LRFLTPTENKRLNELIGFLCITRRCWTALALISIPDRCVVECQLAPEGASRQLDGPAALQRRPVFQVFGFAGVPASHGAIGARLAVAQRPPD